MEFKHYKIDTPTAISLSGGRTSAAMLFMTLEANGGLPEGSHVVFANTGKEMPQTLDFVRDIEEAWGIPITWLELGDYVQDGVYKSGDKEGLPRWRAETRVVSYETASRNGEPFRRLCERRKYLPNIMSRFCTAELKVRRIRDFLNAQGDDWTQFIGIRADEPRRAAKIHDSLDQGHHMWAPMFLDGVTKEDVHAFWQAQPFNLNLPSVNGTTDWGNCDLCFLKGESKKISLIREKPELADWWIEMERDIAKTQAGSAARFRNDQPSYEQMKIIATDQGNLFDWDTPDISINCYCGD